MSPLSRGARFWRCSQFLQDLPSEASRIRWAPPHSGNASGADSFRRNLAKNMKNVFGRLGVTSSRPAWTAFLLGGLRYRASSLCGAASATASRPTVNAAATGGHDEV